MDTVNQLKTYFEGETKSRLDAYTEVPTLTMPTKADTTEGETAEAEGSTKRRLRTRGRKRRKTEEQDGRLKARAAPPRIEMK